MNRVFKIATLLLVIFGSFGCATFKDPRHKQFENVYSQPLNAEDTKELTDFIGDVSDKIKQNIEEQTNKTGERHIIKVVVDQVMLVDGNRSGVISLSITFDKKSLAVVDLFITKSLNWSIASIYYKPSELPPLK